MKHLRLNLLFTNYLSYLILDELRIQYIMRGLCD